MSWLDLTDLSCVSASGALCLAPLSLHLQSKIVVVAGSNASGKTVLGRIVSGLSPDVVDGFRIRGELKFIGGEVRPHDPDRFAYLPQTWALSFVGNCLATDLELSIRGLALPAQTIESRLADLGLVEAQLLHRAPLTLSRGERQRVALAVLATLRPRAVYLDEPDAFLDEQGVASLMSIIESLAATGTYVVVATHHPGIYAPLAAQTFQLQPPHCNTTILPSSEDRDTDSCATHDQQGVPGYLSCNAADFPNAQIIKMAPDRTLEIDSLPVQSGSLTAVVGPNGSGKTTLLLWLHECSRSAHTRFSETLRPVVMVTEEADDQLLFRSIRDEIRLVGIDRMEDLNELHHAVVEHLGGCDRQTVQLSWGMRRLLTVLLAALRVPSVMLIDEPDAGLDQTTEAWVAALLQDVRRNGTAVVATMNHRRETWRVANHQAEIQATPKRSVVKEWSEE